MEPNVDDIRHCNSRSASGSNDKRPQKDLDVPGSSTRIMVTAVGMSAHVLPPRILRCGR